MLMCQLNVCPHCNKISTARITLFKPFSWILLSHMFLNIFSLRSIFHFSQCIYQKCNNCSDIWLANKNVIFLSWSHCFKCWKYMRIIGSNNIQLFSQSFLWVSHLSLSGKVWTLICNFGVLTNIFYKNKLTPSQMPNKISYKVISFMNRNTWNIYNILYIVYFIL